MPALLLCIHTAVSGKIRVEPPQLSIVSVIRVWKGTEQRSSVQNIIVHRQNKQRTCFTWCCRVSGWFVLTFLPLRSEIDRVTDLMKAPQF